MFEPNIGQIYSQTGMIPDDPKWWSHIRRLLSPKNKAPTLTNGLISWMVIIRSEDDLFLTAVGFNRDLKQMRTEIS